VNDQANLVLQGLVTNVEINAPVMVTGGQNIQKAVIKAEGVKLDEAPQETELGDNIESVTIGEEERDKDWIADANAVRAAQADLTLGDVSTVTADLMLPLKQGEATITWASSNTNAVTVDGKVTRPAAGQEDVTVTLTATITVGQVSMEKTFEVTVKALSKTSGGSGGGGGLSTTKGSKFIKAATGGTISFEQLTVEIPAGVLPKNATFTVGILKPDKADDLVPEDMRVKLGSDVYEITTTGQSDFGDNTIAIKIAFDSSKIAGEEQPVLHYYDEPAGEWVALETTVIQENGNWYAVTHVNHLTKFAIFSTVVEEVPEIPDVKVIKLTIGQLAASISGTPYTMDVKPYIDIRASRTMVPVRFISEALGAGVEWIPTARQVKITDAGKVITLNIGSPNVLVDGIQSTIDCAPEIVSDRTFIPLRFVSENLGAQVHYENLTKEITITR